MTQISTSTSHHPDLWRRAEAVIPRGVSSGHRVGWDQVLVHASGAHVVDADGKQYIDYLLAWGAIVVGHSDARVNEAVQRAASTCDLTGIGPQYGEIELAEVICEVMPSAERVVFCTSGTDATMHAVHIARAATGRRKLLKFHGSYHGWHDQLAVGSARNDTTATSALNVPNGGGLHPGSVADVLVVEWNDFAGLQAAFDDNGPEIAAAFCEPYVHSFGCVPAAPGFLELLRELCTSNGSALVFDEMKTGFRAAIGGYQSVCGVTPDLTAFGKAIANGYSLAGLAGSEAIMGHLGAYSGERATIDGTYNASPYAMAAANKTLEIMRTGEVFPRTHVIGDRLRCGFAEAIASAGVPACVVGFGSEWTIYFRPEAPTNFRETMDCDAELFRRYHAKILAGGILEPSFPTGDRRLCAATSDADVDRTLEVASAALHSL